MLTADIRDGELSKKKLHYVEAEGMREGVCTSQTKFPKAYEKNNSIQSVSTMSLPMEYVCGRLCITKWRTVIGISQTLKGVNYSFCTISVCRKYASQVFPSLFNLGLNSSAAPNTVTE